MHTTTIRSAITLMALFLFVVGCGSSSPSTPTFPAVAPADATTFAGRQLTAAAQAATRSADQTSAAVAMTVAAATPTPCVKERYNQPEADGAVNHVVVLCDGAFHMTPVSTAVKQQLAPAAAPTNTRPPATATPRPAPATSTPTVRPAPAGNCHPSYPDFCIPPAPPDLDCADVGRKRFKVLQPDPHKFDGNFDGIGCE